MKWTPSCRWFKSLLLRCKSLVKLIPKLLRPLFKSCFLLKFAAIPKHLVGFTMDPSLPTDQQFLLLTVEGLNAVIRDVGGERGFVHVQTEWNCHAQVLDYGDLTYRPLLSPFDVGLTIALYYEGRVSKNWPVK